MTELNTFGVKVAESYRCKSQSLLSVNDLHHPHEAGKETHKCDGLEDVRLAFLGKEPNIDVWRDLEVIPFRLVHCFHVRDEAHDRANFRPARSITCQRWRTLERGRQEA